jgi:hypothetical protein
MWSVTRIACGGSIWQLLIDGPILIPCTQRVLSRTLNSSLALHFTIFLRIRADTERSEKAAASIHGALHGVETVNGLQAPEAGSPILRGLPPG